MKSYLFEAIETFRTWYLQDQQDKNRTKKDIRLKKGGWEVAEKCSSVVRNSNLNVKFLVVCFHYAPENGGN